MADDILSPCLCGFQPLTAGTLRKHRTTCAIWLKRDTRSARQRLWDELAPTIGPMFKNWVVTLPVKDPALQKLVSVETRPGVKSVVLVLACGHKVQKKQAPKKADREVLCPECRSEQKR